ncbi:MAG: GDYXXLXY domain-containing protein [Bacillota bacterium]
MISDGALSEKALLQNKMSGVAGRLITLGYILGISLILAAVVYFFAANWRGMPRYGKIALSIGLIILFYSLSFIFARAMRQRALLSDLLLFGGCVSFGVGLALLGQLYNAHADSYLLFLVWLAPALLFSLITRYQPFYVLSYILFHLAAWFFLWPSSHLLHWGSDRLFAALLLLAAINAAIFLVTEFSVFESPPLRFLGFTAFHLALIPLTVSSVFPRYAGVMTALYAAVAAWLFYLLLKKNALRGLSGLLSCAATLFLIVKFAELVMRYSRSVLIYLAVLLFAALLVAGNVLLLKYLNRGGPEAGKGARNRHRAFTAFITFAASLLAVGAIVGLISLYTYRFPAYPLFLIAVIIFILPPLLIDKGDTTVRSTLVCTGLLAVLIASLEIHSLLVAGFLVAIIALHRRIESGAVFSFAYLSVHLLLFITAYKLFSTGFLFFYRNHDVIPALFTCYLLLNAGVYLLASRPWRAGASAPAGGTAGRDLPHAALLLRNSAFFGLLSFFVLTFLFAHALSVHYTVNALFFIALTAFLLWALQRDRAAEYKLGLLFWFAFLGYKYYELAWRLLHKSIALLILGLAFCAAAYLFDYARGARGAAVPALFSVKLSLILPLIALQLLIVGFQAAKSEYLLAHSTLVKLELHPVDPRSLLQGDYIVLGYTIASPDLPLKLQPLEKVQIVLAPGSDGVYRYTGVYRYKGKFNREYERSGDEVLITGRSDGGGLIFGIESYFIPEGSGRELEQTINYAYVRVAGNGASLLVEVAEE